MSFILRSLNCEGAKKREIVYCIMRSVQYGSVAPRSQQQAYISATGRDRENYFLVSGRDDEARGSFSLRWMRAGEPPSGIIKSCFCMRCMRGNNPIYDADASHSHRHYRGKKSDRSLKLQLYSSAIEKLNHPVDCLRTSLTILILTIFAQIMFLLVIF